MEGKLKHSSSACEDDGATEAREVDPRDEGRPDEEDGRLAINVWRLLLLLLDCCCGGNDN